MAFRKRRILPAPNKNLAKSLRRQELQDRPRLDGLFPSVARLTISLNFFSPQGDPLEHRRLELGAGDAVDFRTPCPGSCGDGRMDLEGKITDMISKGETSSESRGRCTEPLYAGGTDECGHELRCHIEVSYRIEPSATLQGSMGSKS